MLLLSEKTGGGNIRSNIKSSAVISKSKFAIAAATLGNLIGYTRNDMFYRSEYDFDEIKIAAETDSYLSQAIHKYSELFMKSGYVFKGENDKAVEYLEKRIRIMSYMSDNSFELLMRETAHDLVKFGNAFWVKTRIDNNPFIQASPIGDSKKVVGGYFRLDPSQVRIRFDKKGEITQYKQVTPSNREKNFNPNDVIHFTFDRDPGSVWGKPRWLPVMEDIRLLRKLEGNVSTLAWRYAIPMVQAKVGSQQPGMGATKKEIEETRRVIESTPPDGILITNSGVELKMLGAEGNAMDLSPYLSYFENRVFTGLNTSQAMMGRGGSAQDADSMEEQIHNAVKDQQATFTIQFSHEVITELLLEGGFNPILNEKDIVNLVFNEINLDTRVKLENHEVNLFQTNAITFKEMRTAIGYKNSNVDENELYANMIQQKNTLEQIKLNHKNAMELAKLSAQLASSASDSNNNNNETDNDDSDSNGTNASSGKKTSNYVKKNTGNGKTTSSGRTNKTVTSIDSPQNQHGTYSAKIKESVVADVLLDKLEDDGSNESDIRRLFLSYIQSSTKVAAKEGAKKALDEIKPDNAENNAPILAPENQLIFQFIKENFNSYMLDIKNNAGNITDRESFKSIFSSQKYRLNYMADFAYRKAYWYAYLKTCESYGINKVVVRCNDGSRHKDEHAGKIINARNFTLGEIPGFSSHCKCWLEPAN